MELITWLVIYAALIVMWAGVIWIGRRNKAVFNIRMDALDIIGDLNRRDISELTPRDIEHPLYEDRAFFRFDLFEEISYEDMLWSIKPVQSFFEGRIELDPNITMKQIIWS